MSRIENGFSLYGDCSALPLLYPDLLGLRFEALGDLAQLTSFFLDGEFVDFCFMLSLEGVGVCFPLCADLRFEDELFRPELFKSECKSSFVCFKGDLTVLLCWLFLMNKLLWLAAVWSPYDSLAVVWPLIIWVRPPILCCTL